MKIYVASKAKHAHWWRALQAAGVPIDAPWITWQGNAAGAEPGADDWRKHWAGCIDAAAAVDICLFVNLDGEQACGALIEAGAAIAAGKRVFVVSPDWWSFQTHPRARVFGSVADAVRFIMAGAAAS
jgi:hypothetical protein